MHASRRFTASVSFTLVTGILWALFLAKVPQLHEVLHHDAEEAGHECVITILQGSANTSASKQVSAPKPVLYIEVPHQGYSPAGNVAACFLVMCVMEHAPPEGSLGL